MSSGRGESVISRLVGEVRKMPPETWPMLRAQWCLPKSFQGLAAYLESLPASAAEAALLDEPRTIPLTVLSASNATPEQREEREGWVRRSPRGRHIIARKSGHWIQLDEPELVLDAIREMVEADLGFLDQFDVQMDMYVVAEHHAAGFERSVECHPEIAALDGSGGFGAGSQISPGILGFRPRAFHLQRDRFGDTPEGQIADDLPLVLAIRDHALGDEGDLGIVRGIQKIRAFYVRIALLIVGMQGVDIDAGVDLAVGRVDGVEDHVAGYAAESSSNIGNHEVPDLESGAGMGRIDSISGGGCRCGGGAHEVLLFADMEPATSS